MKLKQATLVTGAAGFIGSHLIDQLLQCGVEVVGIDNLSRGKMENLCRSLTQRHFHFFEMDMTNEMALNSLFADFDFDMVWHLTANSDIAAGVADPRIDLRDTFLTTFRLVEAMRRGNAKSLAFASTSAVYGVHAGALREDSGPLLPISNYGAMKLASEATISAAVESFLERAWIFRFPNVVGSRATHGIIYDLMRKLRRDPNQLEVLGDGTQQKPYLHVSELLRAMFFIVEHAHEKINCYNIGTLDEGAQVCDIANAVISVAAPEARIRFTGGSKGWVGDVPRFSYSIEKLTNLGWKPQLNSRDAILLAIREVNEEVFGREGSRTE